MDKTFYTLGNDENTKTFEGNTFTATEEGILNYSFYSVDTQCGEGNKEPVQNVQLKINGVEKPEDEEVEQLLDFIEHEPVKMEELANLEKSSTS
ncbi:hypothetical protein ABC371_24335 [Bacillus sp. 1P02SD]